MGKLKLLDLYCGCGGMSIGFEITGAYEVLAGIDCFGPAVESFYANHAHARQAFAKPTDLSNVTARDIRDGLNCVPDVVIGGPPCQGFSKAGRRAGVNARNDQVWHFQRMVCDLRPMAFVMENVDGLLTTGQEIRGKLAATLEDKFRAAGYAVKSRILDAVAYRVPQRRKRYLLVGTAKEGAKFDFPPALCGWEEDLFSRTEMLSTVRDALGDLPSPAQEEPQSYGDAQPGTWLQRFLREGSEVLFNHTPSKHSPSMVKRLREQKAGTRLYSNWNHSWYKLDPDAPATAVKENHRAPSVHFAEPRVTTPRECARLQTIPDRYRLYGTKTAQLIQVGNAVPVLLAASIATALAETLGTGAELHRPHGVSADFSQQPERIGSAGAVPQRQW